MTSNSTPAVRRPQRRILVASLASALAVAASAQPTDMRSRARDERLAPHSQTPAPNGNSITVENCNDDGPGSLRQALRDIGSGGGIDIRDLMCSKITLTTGALISHADSVELYGPFSDAGLVIDAGHSGRVFVHNGSGTLTIDGLTLANGSYTGPYGGGCLYAFGSVLLFGSTVRDCTLTASGSDTAFGGGVYAKGSVYLRYSAITDNLVNAASGSSAGGGVFGTDITARRSTISGNRAEGDNGIRFSRGGGLFANDRLHVWHSTIAGNQAITGGGAYLVGAEPYISEIRSSTISGNHAEVAGGIYSTAPLEIRNSTIASNTATRSPGAGLALFGTHADLQSTIVAGNIGGGEAADIGGSTAATLSGSNNLVIASNRPLPADTLRIDPRLGPLADNGGRTLTHALLADSPAIDRGNNVAEEDYDQRVDGSETGYWGYERVVGPGADIGAFELGAPDHIFFDDFDD